MRWSALFLCVGLTMGACSGGSSKGDKNILRMTLPHDPPTMDPRKGGDVVSSALHFMLFEGLTRLESDGTAAPAQAEHIEISEDGTSYTFTLRKSVWSDGSPVTAYDFEKSWKDILDPAFPSCNAHLFYPIKNADAAKKGLCPLRAVGIQAVDSKTLKVELSYPCPYFLELISFCTFFPVNHKVDERESSWALQEGPKFTSNGYFVLKEWKHSREITLVKNPTYWNPKRVSLSGIRLFLVNHEATVLQMYEQGDIDLVVGYLSPLPLDALPKLKESGELTTSPMGGSTFCVFNTQIFPFSNKHLRKAFASCMHRQEIVSNITQLGEIPALSAIPPILKENNHRAFYEDQDIQGAQEHLKKGLDELKMRPEDLKITYLYYNSELNHKVAQALQQMWQSALGVRVQLEGVEEKVLQTKLCKRDYTMAQTAWYAQYSDQMNLFERFFSAQNVKNYAGWENSSFVSLLQRSFFAKVPSKRLELLERAEEIFIDETPLSCIFHKTAISLFKPYVGNVRTTSLGNICFEQLSFQKRAEQ